MPKRIDSTSEKNVQITLRLDPALLDQANTLVAFLTTRSGLRVVEADVLRQALVRGMRALRTEAIEAGFDVATPQATSAPRADAKRKATHR